MLCDLEKHIKTDLIIELRKFCIERALDDFGIIIESYKVHGHSFKFNLIEDAEFIFKYITEGKIPKVNIKFEGEDNAQS